MHRDQEIFVLVGRKNTGKTTFLIELASISQTKVLVVATFPHPKYIDNGYKIISHNDLIKFNSGFAICCDLDPELMIAKVNKEVRNALVIFEDSTKYIMGNVSRDVRAIIIDHRNKGLDLMFTFHSLPDVPPFLAKNYNRLILFKTGQKHLKTSTIEKFPNYYEIEEAHAEIENHPSDYYNQVIKLQ